MTVATFPGPSIKKFEVTVAPLAIGIRVPGTADMTDEIQCGPVRDVRELIVMTVSLSWINGRKAGDMVDAVTTDNKILRGEILSIRPVRENC